MELGKGESKPTPGNPKGCSKKQITVLNFFRDRDSKNSFRNSNDDGNFSSWGGETNSFRNSENVEYKKGMAFNTFRPSDRENITPSRDPTVDEECNSTLMKGARRELIKMGELEPNPVVMIHANTLHLSKIVQDLNISVRIHALDRMKPHKINMLGWHQHPSDFPKGLHEGSDEVMLALYKLNELIFNAIVVYPFKVYNFESEQFEYKKNLFTKFNSREQNKNYKIYNETVDNITEYFFEYDQLLRQFSLNDVERDLWVFAIHYDFMSYVAQRLRSFHEKGKSLQDARTILTEVIIECARNFTLGNGAMIHGMYAIVNESYPEPRFIKDRN